MSAVRAFGVSMLFTMDSLKKYQWWVIGGVFALMAVAGLNGGSSSSQLAAQSATTAQTSYQQSVANVAPVSQAVTGAAQDVQKTDSSLSNDNYYTNSSGNTVHAPAYTNDGSVPAGASARCGDGTYSFSQHHRGTCSHHGGVAVWY